MKPETIVFDPTPCDFPKPRLPTLPQGTTCLSIVSIRRGQNFLPGVFRSFSRGRYALFEAYRLSGLDSQSAVLAPSYHCRTMIDPALALGGEVLLYPLSEQLSPDLAAIDRMHRQSTLPIRAVLATHFFGIPQSLRDLSTWCQERGIVLIEDCSHAMFTREHSPQDVGVHGDFVISSPYKFISSPDGGLLYARNSTTFAGERALRKPSWSSEIRAVLQTIAHLNPPRVASPNQEEMYAEATAVTRTHFNHGNESRAPAGLSDDYRREYEGLASLRWSSFLHRHMDAECIASARRHRYRLWTEATADLVACRPLIAALPDTCIPYMYPLVIDQPQDHFYWLKHLGVPIWRWDSIVASTCPTATRYRLNLLHLPCHQSIDDRGMRWMIEAVRTVMAGMPKAGPR